MIFNMVDVKEEIVKKVKIIKEKIKVILESDINLNFIVDILELLEI